MEVHALSPTESGSLMSIIRAPLAVIILFLVCLVLAGLTVASAISGALTAACVSSAGLLTILVLVAVVSSVGK